MCFNETVSITPSKPVDEEEDPVDGVNRALVKAIPAVSHHSIMYAPKCLVLVSRLDYIETFRVSFLFFQVRNIKFVIRKIYKVLNGN